MKTKLKLRTHHKKNQKSKRSTVSKKNVKRTQDGGESSLNNFRKYILYDIIDYLGPSLYYTRIQHSESQKEVRLKKNLMIIINPTKNRPEELNNTNKFLYINRFFFK